MSGPFAVETDWGRFLAWHTAKGIRALAFPSARQPVPDTSTEKRPAFLNDLAAQLAAYLNGTRQQFGLPLDLSAGTAFQQRVWRALIAIPYGQTQSYGWLAAKIGKPTATRAVGSACGANPVPIIVPCHRILTSNGQLGGFSAGLTWKKRLLALEKATALC